MLPLKCTGCGGETNTAVTDAWEDEPYGTATKCYFKYEREKWVPGCAYDECPQYMKDIMERRIVWI